MNEETNAKRIIEGLIIILIKRYDTLQKLSDWEIKGSYNKEEYQKAKEYLHMLTTKENRLISQINKDINVLDECENYLIQQFKTNTILEKKLNVITLRIENILNEIEINIPTLEITFLDDEEIMMESYIENEQSFQHQLDEEYIKFLETKIKDEEDKEELIKYKYEFIFKNKHLDDTLEMLDYNPENILEVDDALRAEMLEMTEEEYKTQKEEAIADAVQGLLLDSTFSNQNKEINKERIIELIKKLSPETLNALKEFLEYGKIEETTSQIIDEIKKILNKNGFNQCEETNEDCPQIDETTCENLINIIKLEEQILDEIDKLAQKRSSFKQLESLLKLEEDLISKLNINDNNKEQILEIINDELGFFLKNGNEYLIEEIKEEESFRRQVKNAIEKAIQDQIEEVQISMEKPHINEKELRKELLIINRLTGKINGLDESNIIPSQTTASSHQILQNHLLRSLKMYDELSKKEIPYQIVYYEQYFASPSLTDSLILTEGHSEDLIIPDNALSAKLSNISEIEYVFDKDEQLFEIGEDLIEAANVLLELEPQTEETKAYLDFLAIRLKDIMENISDEHKLSLEEYLEEVNVPLKDQPTPQKKPSKTLTKHPNEAVRKN